MFTASTFDSTSLVSSFISGIVSLFVMLGFLLAVAVFVYMFFQWLKHRRRESYALDFVTLQVKLPKDNEIKIDAAEQMFAGLYSLKQDGLLAFAKPEHMIAFEIVGLKENISFYVSCSREIRDLVEKQIHGAYPQADIQEKDEVNIFTEKGKVSFAALKLEKATYFPIKTYKDLPTDGLSLLTSALGKMSEGEGAIVQFLIEPADEGWKSKGRSYVSGEKKREADPDKATYAHDPKQMEAINTKADKPGFRVSIRIVVSSPSNFRHCDDCVWWYCCYFVSSWWHWYYEYYVGVGN